MLFTVEIDLDFAEDPDSQLSKGRLYLIQFIS